MRDLVETLRHIEKRPEMYFGSTQFGRSLRTLQAFLTGFQIARESSDSPWIFDCFREWVATRYGVLADARGGFEIILDAINGDDAKAFDEFFRLLPDYLKDREKLGFNEIQLRFSIAQDLALKVLMKGRSK